MLDKISDICSIAGFIISFVTLIYAIFIDRKIGFFEKKVLFNTRVPNLIRNLKQYNSQLSKSLESKSERDIKETLNLCRTIIENINPKLPYDLSKMGTKISKILKNQYKSNLQFEAKKKMSWKFWVSTTTLDDLWESYDNLNSLIFHIDGKKNDKKIIS